MQLKKYEIKTYVSKDIYQRVTQESLARRTTRAKIIRDGLSEYFLLREEMANAIETPGELGDHHTGKIIHTLLARTEERLKLIIDHLETQITETQTQLKTLTHKVDQFYFDLMHYLPRIPPELENHAKATAEARYRKWQEESTQTLRSL
ncbi:MAG: hypothetical protein K0S27_1638 [Gammaproteobacteria bacterium]|jgi:hypothetical protein|nr:hypothetical protein [Gammaproteobacteria bacterium]